MAFIQVGVWVLNTDQIVCVQFGTEADRKGCVAKVYLTVPVQLKTPEGKPYKTDALTFRGAAANKIWFYFTQRWEFDPAGYDPIV